MEFIKGSIEFFSSFFSRKRRRSSPKTDNLINLKRKKIDFSRYRDEEISPYSVSNHLKFTPHPPKKEVQSQAEFSDAQSLFRAFVSPNDEKSPEILAAKLQIMRQAVEYGEIAQEKHKCFPNKPSLKERNVDGTDHPERFESCPSWETSEVEPNGDYYETLSHRNNGKSTLGERLDKVMKSMEKIEPYPSWENSKTESPEENPLESFIKEKGWEIEPDSLKEVESILNDERHEEAWGKVKDATLRYKDIKLLRPRTWINDEVVNAYLKLLEVPENVHIFNSFFYEYISGMHATNDWDVRKLKRILKKQGLDNLFTKDFLIFPINLDKNHWVVAQVNNKDKCIEYHDSFGDGSFEKVCETIDECIGVLNREEVNCYKYQSMIVPQQDNYYDCGVFMLQTIRCLVEKREFDYSQDQIDFIRKIIVLELKNQTLYM
ncbi:unnamed protein product [Blepharisma stoltei]|uniref:Ubiquitin-like protease family profile domain-containing protein n=1 Tax=Blepharisma stoltei TaxID=1481888 RepID=A0AAU9K0P3_9CILI|nr:unnamed protein product [Blepharisma stoltei]